MTDREQDIAGAAVATIEPPDGGAAGEPAPPAAEAPAGLSRQAARQQRRAERAERPRPERKNRLSGVVAVAPAATSDGTDDVPSAPAAARDGTDEEAVAPAEVAAPGDGAMEADGTGMPPEEAGAPNGVDTADDNPSALAPKTARKGKERKATRASNRIDQHREAAESTIATLDPQNNPIAPLVRYVNAVSLHMDEVHQTLGQLRTENDALRRQLATLNGHGGPIVEHGFAPVGEGHDEEDDDAEPRERGVQVATNRAEVRAARRQSRRPAEAGPPPEEITAEASRKGRRRRLIALGILVAIGAVALIMKEFHQSLPSMDPSKGGLASAVPALSGFMQVFLTGWLVFRVARVGGKGAKWLFPETEKNTKRRRS